MPYFLEHLFYKSVRGTATKQTTLIYHLYLRVTFIFTSLYCNSFVLLGVRKEFSDLPNEYDPAKYNLSSIDKVVRYLLKYQANMMPYFLVYLF
jgi:hypothetical protein